jgi:hypothetical protein
MVSLRRAGTHRRWVRVPVTPIVAYVRGGRGSELWEEFRLEEAEE